MQMLKDFNHYWSSVTQLLHLGSTIRVKEVSDSNDLAKWLTGKLNAQYDLRYSGSSDEFIITEFFGSLGGIMVYTPDSDFNCKVVELATRCDTPRFDVSKIGPKYPSISLPVPDDLETLVILPGSNLLGSISDDVLRFLYDNGAYFKPHPVTHKDILYSLKLKLGKQLLTTVEDVYPLIRAAKRVVCQDSSETGIYASLMGVKHEKLCFAGPGSAYHHYYRQLPEIGKILNTSESGFFLPNEDWDMQLERYLTHLKRVRES